MASWAPAHLRFSTGSGCSHTYSEVLWPVAFVTLEAPIEYGAAA